jgi:hypothetical protein
MNAAYFLSFLLMTSALIAQSNTHVNGQGAADLGMSRGIRSGPVLNSANSGDASYLRTNIYDTLS